MRLVTTSSEDAPDPIRHGGDSPAGYTIAGYLFALIQEVPNSAQVTHDVLDILALALTGHSERGIAAEMTRMTGRPFTRAQIRYAKRSCYSAIRESGSPQQESDVA